MKYVVVLADGMEDYALPELDGKMPKEAAKMPNFNWLRENGVEGIMNTVPQGITPGSDVANLSVLGYKPETFYTGRGALEAAGRGIALGAGEIAFRCNFITEKDGKIVDYSAGHLTDEESRTLVDALKPIFNDKVKLHHGVSFRNILTMKGYSEEVECKPPHDFLDQSIDALMPKPKNDEGKETAELLNKLIAESKEILTAHKINEIRKSEGKNVANMIWPWSPGVKPKMRKFYDMWKLNGAVITAVDIIRGIAVYAGMDIVEVPGATSYYDTNYENKGKYGLKTLDNHDFVFVHIEAPDEAGHAGKLDEKIRALESIDEMIISRFMGECDIRIAVMADHATPVKLRMHVADPVPFVVCDLSGKKLEIKGTMMETLVQ